MNFIILAIFFNLKLLFKIFKEKRKNNDNDNYNDDDDVNIFGEKIKLDKLNIMDNVLGLADKLNEFESFLKIYRKFGFSCIHLLHITYLKISIWQMIILQTKIFNIFPVLIEISNIVKIITNKCNREL